MKYNKSKIMKRAWSLFKCWNGSRFASEYSFSKCLKMAWGEAKTAARKAVEAAEAAAEAAKVAAAKKAQGVVRMSYAEYKNDYSYCRSVCGSYDKKTKTIEVYTSQKAGEMHMYTNRGGRRIQLF